MVDPVALGALAAFGLERSFQLVSFLLLKHRSKNDSWIDDLAKTVARTSSVDLDHAHTQRLAAWLREATVWEQLLQSSVPTNELVNDLADAVYLSHEPRPDIDLHDRLESNRVLAAQLLTDISVGVISASDPAIATAILTSRIQHAQFDLATQFLQVLADDNVALLDSADSNHRELLALGTEHERALELHKSALAGLVEHGGPDSDDAMDARRWLAVTQRRAGNPSRAVELHEQIEDWFERTGGRGPVSRLINRSTMVMALTDASRFEEAVTHGALAVDEATDTLGPEHPETLSALDNLARAQLRVGKADAAVANTHPQRTSTRPPRRSSVATTGASESCGCSHRCRSHS